MPIKNWTFLLAMLFGVLLANQSYANMNADKPFEKKEKFQKNHEKMEKHNQKMFNQLNLSDEQKSQWKEVRSKNKEAKQALYQQIKSYRESLQQELLKTDFDINKVNQIHSDIKNLQSQIADIRLNMLLETRKILTAEQFQKFNEIKHKHKKNDVSMNEEGEKD